MSNPICDSAVPALETIHLCLRYETDAGTVSAVEDISLRIDNTERLVLLGPSGCGKSSILKAVAGFIPAASGQILVDGKAINGPSADRIVVFQEFDQLLPWKTVRHNVTFPLRVARRLSGNEANARAEAALAKVGLTRAIDAFPHTLSGGMKQRVAIARALAMQPDILLMDEPFAALDALTRNRLQADLLVLAEDLRFTLLFVTHSVEEAVLIGTQVHVLSAHPGRSVASFDTRGIGVTNRTTAGFTAMVGDITATLFPGQSDLAA